MADILSDAAITAALGRQMTRAVQRQAVAAGNLANLDTPGYHTKEVQFADALDDEARRRVAHGNGPRGTSARARPAAIAPTPMDAAGLPSRRDGNNVQLDRELLSMTRAAGDFSAAQTALAAKFRLVRYAINEGR